jgi:hypothetical protein
MEHLVPPIWVDPIEKKVTALDSVEGVVEVTCVFSGRDGEHAGYCRKAGPVR